MRQSILGQMVTASPCPRCQGFGEEIEQPCAECSGEGRHRAERTLTIEVPAGVDSGSTLRLSGHGPAGFRGGPNGSLFVHLAVDPDDVFERTGDDLRASLHVAMTQATLGATVSFTTLDDVREITIDPGTQCGRVVKLRGLGVPHVRGRGRGDLFLHVVVDTPADLDDQQREVLASFAALRGEEIASAAQGGLLNKLRSASS